MTESPPVPRPLRLVAGQATLTVSLVAGQSAVTAARAASPLKLLTPRARGRSAWACLGNFGGGYVAGDETRLEVHVGRGAACFVGTQASTKVYRNPLGLACGHTTHARVEDDALLVFAPDVVQAFADSTYSQRQEFHLAPRASLALLDWLSSGRTERGEQWAFRRYQSRNDVWTAGDVPPRRLFLDSLRLDSNDGPLLSPRRMGRFQCLALLFLAGPALAAAAAGLLDEILRLEVPRRAPLVTSASPVAGGALLRVAGESTEAVRDELHRRLSSLTPLLGDDPWGRWGRKC